MVLQADSNSVIKFLRSSLLITSSYRFSSSMSSQQTPNQDFPGVKNFPIIHNNKFNQCLFQAKNLNKIHLPSPLVMASNSSWYWFKSQSTTCIKLICLLLFWPHYQAGTGFRHSSTISLKDYKHQCVYNQYLSNARNLNKVHLSPPLVLILLTGWH